MTINNLAVMVLTIFLNTDEGIMFHLADSEMTKPTTTTVAEENTRLKSEGYLDLSTGGSAKPPINAESELAKKQDDTKTKEKGKKEPKENVVEMVFFAFKTHVLSDKAKKKLNALPKNRKYKLVGYTDSIGSIEFNNMLAILRATTTALYLRSLGVFVIEYYGRGSCCYLDPLNQDVNRRVEIIDVGPLEGPRRPPKKTEWMRFMWLSDISANSTYSSLVGGSSIMGGNASAVLAPTVQFGDNKFLIVLNNTSYQKRKQVYTEDEGPRLSSEYLTNTLTPTFKYSNSDKLDLSPGLFFTQSYSKETQDEIWFKGLYDYEESGYSFDIRYVVGTTDTSSSTMSLGYQKYDRVYPNFKSLFSIAGFGTLEEHEKDFAGTSYSMTYAVNNSLGLSYTLNLNYLLKEYVDKLVENEFGGRDPERQLDVSQTGSLMLTYKASMNSSIGFRITVNDNLSNQNLVEGSFPDFIFHKNYFSYQSTTVSPDYSYIMQLSDKKRVTFRTAYNVTRTNFYARYSRNELGELTDQLQEDWAHSYSASARYTLNEHWSFSSMLDVSASRSNLKDELFFRSNYEIINISFGFSYHY
ncbi:MAG: hypothetical protein OEY64_06560 [Nitrospinota bacterium]|nr:hypothetical protein [Nitrospinota bacterium]